MAYDEDLAARVRSLLASRSHADERKRPAGLEGDGLDRWVQLGAARAESLPPK